MPAQNTIPIIRTRDGSRVNVGDTWDTGDTVDMDGNVVESAKPVELLKVEIPPTGEGYIGTATVRIDGTIVEGRLMIRDTHPAFPGRRIAFLET